MAFTRRNTNLDATWQRAWTADTVADLASISAIGGTAGPRHGDIAFVDDESIYYLWMDDGTWRPLPMIDFGQLPFPATQNPSVDPNTLDDYEEGSWTPDVMFGGGNTGITYAIQSGLYTKIGRFVACSGFFILTSKGSDTGDASIAGLPFTLDAGFGAFSGAKLPYSNFSVGGIALVAVAGTAIAAVFYDLAGVNTNATDAEFTNNSSMIVYICYMADQ